MNLALPWRRQRGVAAVEFAVLLPCLALVLASLILCARLMWHYTVAHKAAQDAARYMATVPAVEMRSPALAVEAKAVAVEIAKREMVDLALGRNAATTDVQCDSYNCGFLIGEVPSTVKVALALRIRDPIFNLYLGPYGLPIVVNVVEPYVGK
ncbi:MULTISPECIES: TadE/TadG family type IV pilus assembly protein [Massilia]|uniref:TadE-like domain-containing protein n=1 Tax=Massilia aurea TaxID=373040 RepID=A0A422QQD0_9BURK|nr:MULTISPECIES: TadE/TadG family type IV pilus assembly protein [Massilia]MDY0961108.1 TadE/TadG family type IV pilus assembly protein [Massilia sp. CFBP9026]RNF32204.1 hypothetical protein NM04_03205 [Massilia aurea]